MKEKREKIAKERKREREKDENVVRGTIEAPGTAA